MAKLIFIGDKFGGRAYEFAVEKTTVGRGDHNTLTIQDASVSHSHCEILVYGTEVIVRDLGSSNGTFVNGARLQNQQRPVLAGQIVKFGTIEARLELESRSTSDTATDLTAVYSHARHQRERQSTVQHPKPAFTTLETGPESAPAEHTVFLPRSPQAVESASPAAAVTDTTPTKTSRTLLLAGVVAVIVLGLAVLCWLVMARNR